MILRARIVVTMNGPPIENGALFIEGERIAEVGKFSELNTRRAGEVVDLGEQILLPGLINAHCHLDYTCLRGKIPPRDSFTEWIRAINAEKANLSPDDYVASITEGFAEAKRFGTTTIANLTAFPELIARIASPIRTWWFAELIDVREPKRARAIVERALEFLKAEEHWGLAPHALFTASPELYRQCEREAQLLTTHLAESREEMLMFRDKRGPLYEFLTNIGREMSDCGECTPIETFSKVSDSSTSLGMTRRWMLVHVNEVSENDLKLLVNSQEQFSVIHCPRSHQYFRHAPFQLEKFRKDGFNICLGTDSLASNSDLSLFAEMRALRDSHANLSPPDILEMVTINSAHALDMGNSLGRLQPGFFADLVAIPAKPPLKEALEAIVGFENSLSWMMVDGKAAGPSTA
jgi:cytosine/adenosine deaminase-related metal-dependent hydrolase